MEEVKIDGITITKKEADGKNYYEVKFDYPSESSFKDLIKVVRNEIEEGKLTPLDKIMAVGNEEWKKKFDNEVEKIMKEKYPEFPLKKVDKWKIRKGEHFSQKDFITMLDTIALLRKNGDTKILFKLISRTEDLKEVVNRLDRAVIKEVGLGKWYMSYCDIVGDVYG
ncbi:MAG: hypothetical protein QW038_02480 [Nanopusillaceae archaeon]